MSIASPLPRVDRKDGPGLNEAEPPADRLPRVDRHLRIETPENVVLTYVLAGPAVRCAAWLVDSLVRVVLIFALGMLLSFTAVVSPGMSMGLYLLLLFLIEWGYFVACEMALQGRSIGKFVFGLRVVHERGHPVTFWSSLIRNLLRAADAMPVLLYGVGLIAMLLTKRFQRLGDLVARTVVVEERQVELPREPIILEKIRPLPREELGSYAPRERTLSIIEQFLGRRHVLSHERGHALAWPLAQALSERLNYTGDRSLVEEYPMAFLARVYVTLLRRDEEES